jgi:hypothetical protein
MNHRLENLIESIYNNYPDVSDAWEITAIVESLGYTDRMIQEEFGCPNALVLAEFVYAQRDRFPDTNSADIYLTQIAPTFKQELEIFIQEFSHSFVYTIPFIVFLLINYLPIDRGIEFLPPKLTPLFAIATMASLITSGGFVQMISRRGAFYQGLQDPIQGNRVCIPILWMGIVTSICCAVIGIFFGFYQSVAADEYIIIAGIYYAILSIVWMLFAMASIQAKKLGGMVLIGITILFAILRIFANLGAIESQIFVMTIAAIVLASSVIINSIKNKPKQPKIGQLVALPSLSSLVYLLAPHFCYGVVYFSFIFADRLAASLANTKNYLSIPGNNLDYQDSMDLALLNLLLLVPLIEYFSYKLIIYWYRIAKNASVQAVLELPPKIERQYNALLRRSLICFLGLVILTFFLLLLLDRRPIEGIVTLIGCFGYLCFAIGLFNSIILLSLDRLIDVLKSLIPGTLINFLAGYILSNLFGVYFSAIGLVIGAIYFALLSRKRLLKVTKQADFCYFFSGY